MTSRIEGPVHPDFAPVAEILEQQIPRRSQGGAALAIVHRGETVVDCWGGTRNRAGDPWQADTLAVSFSTTKGVASTLLHTLADEGALHYDDPVCRHWPEFAAAGKDQITVRQILCHEAGLHRIRDLIDDASRMTDWSHMTATLAAARPAFLPGSANAYHGLTYGWLIGELVRRVSGQRFTDALRTRLAEPLGADGLYCGLPASELDRAAELIDTPSEPGLLARLWFQGFKLWLRIVSLGRYDLDQGVAALLPRGAYQFDYNDPTVLQASIPAANGTFTARSLARLYAAIGEGGSLDGVRILSPECVAGASTIQNRRPDRVLLFRPHWRLGYHKLITLFGPKTSGFGHAGYGGSGGWIDPERRLAFGMTLNSGVGTPLGDSRIVELSREALRCADRRS